MIEAFWLMHVVCEPQRRCDFFGPLKLLCASAALVSHHELILAVGLESLHTSARWV